MVSTVTGAGSGLGYGIFCFSANLSVRDDDIDNCQYGVVGGKYKDNLVSSCTTPFSGGTDAGGNN